MKITYYGHSCFLVEVAGKRLLFDPFVSGNSLVKGLKASDLRCDYILPTHAHADHIGDLDTVVANNPEALVVGIWEMYDYCTKKGYRSHPMNKGGWWSFDFGRVKMVQAVHSSSLADGTSLGEAAGYVLDTPEGVLYIAGDTALTMDMQLIPMTCPPLDVAILPIGSNFTMDVHDAIIAAEFVRCNNIIGCHYDTFGFIKIDHEAAKKAFFDKGKTLTLLAIGESLEV